MSESAILAKLVTNSPINHSTSKQTYTFTKSPRFERKNSHASMGSMYNLPEVLNKRATSLGKGDRNIFSNKKFQAPYYNIPSTFDTTAKHAHIYSFGISREFYKNVYVEGSPNKEKNIPGPGNYNVQKPLGADAYKYSMRGKGLIGKSFTSTLKNPGPGEYQFDAINNKGQYPLSTTKNNLGKSFGATKEKRFNYMDYKVPGPGQYNQAAFINGHGTVFNSKFRSTNSITISTRFKLNSNKNITPGPGAYESFSEFGVHGSNNKFNSTMLDSMKQSQSNFGGMDFSEEEKKPPKKEEDSKPKAKTETHKEKETHKNDHKEEGEVNEDNDYSKEKFDGGAEEGEE